MFRASSVAFSIFALALALVILTSYNTGYSNGEKFSVQNYASAYHEKSTVLSHKKYFIKIWIYELKLDNGEVLRVTRNQYNSISNGSIIDLHYTGSNKLISWKLESLKK